VAAKVGSIAFCGMVCSSLTLAGVLYPCRTTNESQFHCSYVEALEEALAKHGKPEIFNSDSQRIKASFRAA
jgi:hypothetical protein